MKVSILGAGAYGLALSSVCHDNNCNTIIWSGLDNEVQELREKRCNLNKLPKYQIPSDIDITSNLKEAILGSELIIIAVPAGFVDDVSKSLKDIIACKQHICIASKGIEQDTCLFIHDVVRKYIDTDNLAVISGGSFAVNIVDKVPVGLTLATTNEQTANVVTSVLQNDYLKLRRTDDIIGTSICGSIKNVIALASGMIDGMDLPISTKAMFITESLHDIKGLIKALGGDKNTILSFAGFGDLLLTCTSEKSRNFTFGKMIGSGCEKEVIDEYMNNTTIEGLYTLKSIYTLLNNKQVDMPIIDLIYDIIYHDESPKQLVKFLNVKE